MPDSIVGNEFLPNVHIEKISYQEVQDRVAIQVEIALYDYEQRTWSIDGKFTGYLLVNLAYCGNKIAINELKQGTRGLSPDDPELSFRTFGFVEMEGPRGVTIESKQYVKFKKTVQYSLSIEQVKRRISYFANSSLSIQDLKDNEGLNLSYSRNNYRGSITGEDIIRDGQRVVNSNAFLDENGEYWAGPVHLHPDSGYMEGSEHRQVPHKRLTLDTTVPNAKVEFLNNLTFASNDPYVSQEANITREGNIDTPLGIDLPGPRRQGIVSLFEQDYVQDILGNINGTFITDMYSLSLSESRVAKIMHNYDKPTFMRIASNLNINNIMINRHTIEKKINFNPFKLKVKKLDMSKPNLIAKSFNNAGKVKESSLYKVSSTEKLAVQPKDVKAKSKKKIFDGTEVTKDVIEQGQKIGTIRQLNLTLPKNLRAISFTDHELKNLRGSEFGYSIDIRIKDEFLTHVKAILKDLTLYSYRLENFQSLLVAKNVYDGDKFKIDFLTEYYSQYGIEVNQQTGTITSEIDMEKLKNIFIFKAFEVLKEAEMLSGLPTKADSLLTAFNLFSTTPDRMDKSTKYYNKVIDHFRKVYDINIEKNYGRGAMKSPRKDRPNIEKTLKLKNTYTKPLLPKIGFNYISEKRHEGIGKFDLSIFRTRAEKETKKFFKRMPSKSDPILASLKDEDKSLFIDLNENKFKHFTPSRMFFGKKEIDTTKLNPEGMDVNFFADLKIAREVASQTQESHNPDNAVREESPYTDSRNYLGEDTKFSNSVLRTLKINPAKIRRLRKETKLLDKALLKRKGKRISLDSFDLTTKNNLVAKTFTKDIKSVPIQLKALSMLKTETTNFDVKALDFDPLANPQTDEVIKQNFLNIGKVEYLDGFEMRNGIPMLNKPIYKEITPRNIEQLKTKNVLCQIKITNFDNLTIDDTDNFQIFDKVFTMENNQEDQMDVGETQQLSEDTSDMTEIFVNTILSPTLYSSAIISQNEDNASIVKPLRTDGAVITGQTAEVTTNINVAPTPTIGGSY